MQKSDSRNQRGRKRKQKPAGQPESGGGGQKKHAKKKKAAISREEKKKGVAARSNRSQEKKGRVSKSQREQMMPAGRTGAGGQVHKVTKKAAEWARASAGYGPGGGGPSCRCGAWEKKVKKLIFELARQGE